MQSGNFLKGGMASPQEIWRNLMRNYGLELETVIPAVVVSYDRAKNIVTCQPAINRTDLDGNSIQRTLLIVPCFNPAGSSIGINFPLSAGDTGWVIASDRDTENFVGTLKVANAKTANIHKYSFGFFIPDKIHDFVINPEDDGALVIETVDGTTRISIKGGQITLTSTNNVKVNTVTAEVSASGEVNIQCDSANVNCPDTQWTGTITVDGDVIANGISLTNHVHFDTANQTIFTGKPQ